MKTIATIVEGGVRTGIISGPDACNQTIKVNGRIWRFDYDRWGGPLWLKKDFTTPRKCQCPNKAVWKAWERWLRRWERRGQ